MKQYLLQMIPILNLVIRLGTLNTAPGTYTAFRDESCDLSTATFFHLQAKHMVSQVFLGSPAALEMALYLSRQSQVGAMRVTCANDLSTYLRNVMEMRSEACHLNWLLDHRGLLRTPIPSATSLRVRSHVCPSAPASAAST